MNPLRHLFHRHTAAVRADAGHIVLCHRRTRTDAQVRPAGHRWIAIRDVTFDELRYLIGAVDNPNPYSDNAHMPASERLLYRAALIQRRHDTPAGAR